MPPPAIPSAPSQRAASKSSRRRRRAGTPSLASPAQIAARLAEAWVAEALARQGWRLVARNYRRHGFELDLVAAKGETLTIVEVKALRKRPRHGRDVEGLLGHRKRQALQRGARQLLAELALSGARLRFDLAIVVGIAATKPPEAVFYHVNVLD